MNFNDIRSIFSIANNHIGCPQTYTVDILHSNTMEVNGIVMLTTLKN